MTLEQVIEAAAEIYKPEGVAIWLDAPSRSLPPITPRQYVELGQGDKVLRWLKAMAEGALS